jgi:hypothetical protein
MDKASLVFEHAVRLGVDGCDGEAASEGIAELRALAGRDRRHLDEALYRLEQLQPGPDTDLALGLVRQAVGREVAGRRTASSGLNATRAAP